MSEMGFLPFRKNVNFSQIIARLMQAADGMCCGSSDLTYAESMALSGNLLRKISVGTQDPGAAWLGTRTLF